MKELFQLSFRCTKLKCGFIWAFVVMSSPGPRRERHLGSAICRVPCEKSLRGVQRVAGSLLGCSFLSCRGCFVQLGLCSRRGLCDSTQNINTNWKTCEIQVERFWECSASVFILLFTFVLFSLGIQQALYISLILSRCNFLLRSKCYDIVYYNCKLKLWTFKAGSKNKYGLFCKIHCIHTFN